jgi:RIO-like serine/threonine protein kinase
MSEEFKVGFFGELAKTEVVPSESGESLDDVSVTVAEQSKDKLLSVEERRERIEKKMRQIVENLLITGENRIGVGKTAQVHTPEDNEEICFKIVTSREVMGTNAPPPRIPITDADPFSPETQHADAEHEGQYLEDLQGIDYDVFVPQPIAYTTYEYPQQEGDTYLVKETVNILAMRRLDAVSLKDVIEGVAEVPSTMKPDTFFSQLRSFVERMHMKGIYHRDFHSGNIMIDKKTGRPCVIDFGRASYGSGDDAYRFEHHIGAKKVNGIHGKDEDYLEEAERLFHKYMKARESEEAEDRKVA